MSGRSTEFKVGVFVLLTAGLIGGSFLWSVDGVRPSEASYTLTMHVESSEGLYVGSSVRLAGVEIGSVEAITIAGDKAEIVLRIRDAFELPLDSAAELKAQGLLGDYFVRVYPGVDEGLLVDGDRIATRSEPGDIDTITRNVERISDDIVAITGALRLLAENQENSQHIEATLANLDALTAAIRMMAETNQDNVRATILNARMLTGEINGIASENRRDIAAVVDSVRRLSESLEGWVDRLGANADGGVTEIRDLARDLDVAAEDLSSITGKIDAGKGTVGALINERDTIDRLNDAIEGVNQVVQSFSGLRPEIYYTGRYYMGTDPKDTTIFPDGNQLAGSASNTIGVRLRAHEDFWYNFEINDYPTGVISEREVLREETGEISTKWTKDAAYRFTFQMEKRWGPASFRIGVKENGGGVGASMYAFKDRLGVHADVFDFYFGSYPDLESQGLPNVRLGARVEPLPNFYLEAGSEQIPLGIKRGYFTGYLGLGFHFQDDDVRWVLQGLPLSF
jgi:phospholipid/cholesterol/gamma-HCH transport system substrate-binding protein